MLSRHVVPNSLAPVTVQSTLNFGLAVIDIESTTPRGVSVGSADKFWDG